jgi:hypothetical protein
MPSPTGQTNKFIYYPKILWKQLLFVTALHLRKFFMLDVLKYGEDFNKLK